MSFFSLQTLLPPTDFNESELVKQVAAGDEKAFEILFKHYAQRLINFARRFVFDTTIAENFVQDVFLKVWANREQLDPEKSFKTYLFTAVRNQALHHLRHLEVERRSEENIDLFPEPIKTPEQELSEKEVEEYIRQAIGELPEKCQLIFYMNRFDQLTYTQIAEVQNISIKTVETQMGRALKYLRQRLHQFMMVLPF